MTEHKPDYDEDALLGTGAEDADSSKSKSSDNEALARLLAKFYGRTVENIERVGEALEDPTLIFDPERLEELKDLAARTDGNREVLDAIMGLIMDGEIEIALPASPHPDESVPNERMAC